MHVQILGWFNDRPARECYYSLHNMARTGTFLDKKIGEWFGPNTTAYVLRCVHAHTCSMRTERERETLLQYTQACLFRHRDTQASTRTCIQTWRALGLTCVLGIPGGWCTGTSTVRSLYTSTRSKRFTATSLRSRRGPVRFSVCPCVLVCVFAYCVYLSVDAVLYSRCVDVPVWLG
jgi:hypothetical protein